MSASGYEIVAVVRGRGEAHENVLERAPSAGAALERAVALAKGLRAQGIRSSKSARVLVEVRQKGFPAIHAVTLAGRVVAPVPVPVSEQRNQGNVRAHATAAEGQGRKKR